MIFLGRRNLARFVLPTCLLLVCTLYSVSCAKQASEPAVERSSESSVDVSIGGPAEDQQTLKDLHQLARNYNNGEEVEENPAKAASLYRQACDAGYARSCYNLGYLYTVGRGVAEDQDKAIALFDRACSGGRAVGCFSLGVDSRENRSLGVGAPPQSDPGDGGRVTQADHRQGLTPRCA